MQSILLTSVLAGAVSMGAAALLSYVTWSTLVERMVSLSAGILLSTAFLNALPLAFESAADTHALCSTLLAGLLAFFLLEKGAIVHAALAGPRQAVAPLSTREPQRPRRSGWMMLLGDGLHNFTEGILVAAAFLAHPQLGLLTALAITAHKIPQAMGDLIVQLSAGYSRTCALACNLMCTCIALAGGIVGFLMLEHGMRWVPYVLVVASSGFIYVALSDLLPAMQRRARAADTAPQVCMLALGMAIVLYMSAAPRNL